ncbi:DUF721 domain-containing protein [Hippea alviniae]|uniref:DUF721 domain-containing protein n=1 Tax=Hippea alviniae TaxID=1279027 RepID=UPI000427BDB3|nr:DUF721 domain-containing protein [Hippea alviniae]
MLRSVGQIIKEDLIKNEAFEKIYVSELVFEALKHVLGEGLSSQIKIKGFKDKTVWIGTPNSVFSQELSFFEGEIVKRVNELIGEDVLKRVRFEESWKRKRR